MEEALKIILLPSGDHFGNSTEEIIETVAGAGVGVCRLGAAETAGISSMVNVDWFFER